MEKQEAFDTMSIRRRLEQLKVESGMDALEFCKIYAPEKWEKSEGYARTYISQVFSGGTSFNNKQVSIDIEHLLNIVNSERFPGITLNYLVYGDETPVKTIEKVDLKPEHWSLADFCVFLGKVLDKHTDIMFQKHVKEDLDIDTKDIKGLEDEDFTFYNLVITIPEYFALTGEGNDLGIGLGEYLDAHSDLKDIKSEKARTTMYEQLIKAVYADKRYSEQSLDSCNGDSFTAWEDGGKAIIGLNIE